MRVMSFGSGSWDMHDRLDIIRAFIQYLGMEPADAVHATQAWPPGDERTLKGVGVMAGHNSAVVTHYGDNIWHCVIHLGKHKE